MHGILLINKPEGITSHDVVDRARRITGESRIGHAGTLDPFATGLLILGIGREATKKLLHFQSMDKTYEADLWLGAVSTTYDRTGAITVQEKKHPTRNKIHIALSHFIGRQPQIPPMFSAKKVQGKKLYELARKGHEIPRKATMIEIFDITLMAYEYPKLSITVRCSKGTYIRSFGHDLGAFLGTGAYVHNLKRISIGPYHLRDALSLVDITSENWTNSLFSPSFDEKKPL